MTPLLLNAKPPDHCVTIEILKVFEHFAINSALFMIIRCFFALTYADNSYGLHHHQFLASIWVTELLGVTIHPLKNAHKVVLWARSSHGCVSSCSLNLLYLLSRNVLMRSYWIFARLKPICVKLWCVGFVITGPPINIFYVCISYRILHWDTTSGSSVVLMRS